MIITIQIAGSIIVIITIIALAYKKKENKKYNDFIDKFEKNNKKENKEIHIEKENNKTSQNDEKLLDCYEKVYKTNYKTMGGLRQARFGARRRIPCQTTP